MNFNCKLAFRNMTLPIHRNMHAIPHGHALVGECLQIGWIQQAFHFRSAKLGRTVSDSR